MLRFGKITGIQADKGLYQVTFDEDQLVSGWIHALVKNTKDNKEESGYDQTEHVAVQMDELCEYGVILGAIYDEKNPPAVGNADVWQKQFKDGTFLKYDRAAHKLTISCEGEIEINGGENHGLAKVAALKEALNALQNDINNLKTKITALLTTPVVEAGNGAASALQVAMSGQLTSWAGANITVTQQGDIENTDIKH